MVHARVIEASSSFFILIPFFYTNYFVLTIRGEQYECQKWSSAIQILQENKVPFFHVKKTFGVNCSKN
jgi:hypothetical protein